MATPNKAFKLHALGALALGLGIGVSTTASADHAPFSIGIGNAEYCIGWSCVFHEAPDDGRGEGHVADHREPQTRAPLPLTERDANGRSDHRDPATRPSPTPRS